MTAVVLVLASGAAWEPAALQTLDRAPGVVVLKRCVDADDLLATAAAGQADVAVVDADAPGLDAETVAMLRHHGVRPVAVVRDDEGARTRVARAGITWQVSDPADLPAAVSADDELPPASVTPPPPGGGSVIAVWGPAGAPGRTTVAVTLAAELARRQVATLLVDADPYGGSVAQQLGILDEISGLLAAARLAATGALPDGFAGVPRAIGTHLGVITGLPRPDRWTEVRPEALDELLATAARHGQVVVDTGFSLEDDPGAELGRPARNQATLGALDVADEIVVVGAADPVGLSRLARGLVDLRERGVGAEVHVVVNRMRSSLGWSEQEIAGTITRVSRPSSLHFLPDDRAAADRALVNGRTLVEVAPDSPLARGVAGLADGFSSRTAGRAHRR